MISERLGLKTPTTTSPDCWWLLKEKINNFCTTHLITGRYLKIPKQGRINLITIQKMVKKTLLNLFILCLILISNHVSATDKEDYYAAVEDGQTLETHFDWQRVYTKNKGC